MRNACDGPGPGPPDEEPGRASFVCGCCGRTIVTAVEGLFHNPAVGSKQRFCDNACRQAAWRRRKAGVPESAPLQRRGGRARKLAEGTGASPEPPLP
jgi:hypothetical protein